MIPSTGKLIDILKQEHQLYKRLLDRLQREKAVMLGSQVRKLTSLAEEKQMFVRAIGKAGAEPAYHLR